MNCKTCGRELEANEKDYCPACKNNNDRQQKSGMAKLGTVLSVIGVVALGAFKIFGGKGGDA